MKNKKLIIIFISIFLIFVLASSIFAAKLIRVVLENNEISTKALKFGGDIYIPAKDIAKMLGVKLNFNSKTSILYLSKKEKAVPLATSTGKLNEWIFNGRTKLIVDRIDEVNFYNGYEPLEADNKFAVIYITQQNGTQSTADIGFDTSKSYLQDTTERKYPPHLYKNASQNSVSPDETFAGETVFSIPNPAEPSLLVLKMIGENEGSIRVSLR